MSSISSRWGNVGGIEVANPLEIVMDVVDDVPVWESRENESPKFEGFDFVM